MARKLSFCCALLALLSVLAAASAHAKPERRTVARELLRLYQSGAIDRFTYDDDRAVLADVQRRVRTLTGARKAELAGALGVVEGIAERGQLRASRLKPLFETLVRNAEWWSTQPLLASGQRVTFAGSELVWQQVPGQGIHLHPLANFGKLNAYAKGSKRLNAVNEQLLDELMALAVPRGGGLAWEYYFTFDGGRGPWVSGLAQGTGLQAIARSAVKLDRLEELLPAIRKGLTLFEQAPPTGVRVRTGAGAHYAQYSFWPELRIVNGFVQSLVGLYDVAQLTGDARAARLFAEGDAQARIEVPAYDTGAWSLYSRGAIERESDLGYHTLLRDFLTNLCTRTQTDQYCAAASHFTGYLTVPPVLRLRTTAVRGGRAAELRFALSKIARASVLVTAPDGRQVLNTSAGVVGRGTHGVRWTVPRRPGAYVVRVDAVDLAGNPATLEGPLEVLKPRRRG